MMTMMMIMNNNANETRVGKVTTLSRESERERDRETQWWIDSNWMNNNKKLGSISIGSSEQRKKIWRQMNRVFFSFLFFSYNWHLFFSNGTHQKKITPGEQSQTIDSVQSNKWMNQISFFFITKLRYQISSMMMMMMMKKCTEKRNENQDNGCWRGRERETFNSCRVSTLVGWLPFLSSTLKIHSYCHSYS